MGPHAEVIDEEDARALVIEALDHVAAYESAAAGDEMGCHAAQRSDMVPSEPFGQER